MHQPVPRFEPSPQIAGMDLWVCSYVVDGISYGINLWAMDPNQLERDHASLGEFGLRVDGRHLGTVEY